MQTQTAFHPHNMFICRSKKILINYYKDIFAWLNSCENLFGFHNLKGYGMTRIYGFLAERFLPYWFKKYSNSMEWPVVYCDIFKNREKLNETKKI